MQKFYIVWDPVNFTMYVDSGVRNPEFDLVIDEAYDEAEAELIAQAKVEAYDSFLINS